MESEENKKKEGNKYRRGLGKPRQEIIKELMERQGGRCPVCGIKLDSNNCDIDRIYPASLGGNNKISNLQLLCRNCNVYKGDTPFLEYQFEKYMENLLSAHPNYSICHDNLVVNNNTIRPDIIIEKKVGDEKQYIIAEITVERSFTEKRIHQRINLLKKYAETFSSEILDKAKVALITPGELPQEYENLVKENKIELWDKKFIGKEFNNQLDKVEQDSFKMMIETPKETEESYDEYQDLIDELKSISPGSAEWGKYQKLVGKIMEALFCPPLSTPISQSNDKDKRNRRDFILPNYTKENDTWKYLREKYNADYVVVDAKNSKVPIKKDDVLQVANYLKVKGAGMFGIIVSREGEDDASEAELRNTWITDNKMIVVLRDTDIESMLLAKKNGNDPSDMILKKIEDFRLSI